MVSEADHGGMTRRHFPSYGSLRAFAARRRRTHLAGSTWLPIVDRDLDRIATDLVVLSQTDEPVRAATPKAETLPSPVDLHLHRAKSARSSRPLPDATPPHARAS
jgi:hypothetical protein